MGIENKGLESRIRSAFSIVAGHVRAWVRRRAAFLVEIPLPRLIRDTAGGAVVLFALGLPVLAGAGALAVDASRLFATRAQLQGAADTSARAAAWEIPNTSVATQEALAYASRNMPAEMHGRVLLEDDVEFGWWDRGDRTFTPHMVLVNAIRVTTRRADENDNPLALSLAPVLGIRSSDVEAQAIAARFDVGDACVLALARSGSGITVRGTAQVVAPQCSLASNSPDDHAAIRGDGAAANALVRSLYSVGGLQDPHGVYHTTEEPLIHTGRPLADPYAERDFDFTGVRASPTADEQSTPADPVVLEPGRYPSGFDFKGVVTLEPGVYVMEGDVRVNAQAVVAGQDVTIVLQDSDITVTGGGSMTLSARQQGSTRGIALMRQGGASGSSRLAGNGVLEFTGAIYMPDSEFRFSGTSAAGGCLQLVVERVEFAGTPSLDYNCALTEIEEASTEMVVLVQ